MRIAARCFRYGAGGLLLLVTNLLVAQAQIPPRTDFDDIPYRGSCEDRAAHFTAGGAKWVCQQHVVPRTNEPQGALHAVYRIVETAVGGGDTIAASKEFIGQLIPSLRNSGCGMSGSAACIESEVAVVLPATAEILDVRYFHKAGDNRDIWARYPPDLDLRWMAVRRANWKRQDDFQVIAATCSNWSNNLDMTCAIGVQYREP